MTTEEYYELRAKTPRYITLTRISDNIVILCYSFKEILFTKSIREAKKFIEKTQLVHEGWI